jgi:hypothetical protein
VPPRCRGGTRARQPVSVTEVPRASTVEGRAILRRAARATIAHKGCALGVGGLSPSRGGSFIDLDVQVKLVQEFGFDEGHAFLLQGDRGAPMAHQRVRPGSGRVSRIT